MFRNSSKYQKPPHVAPSPEDIDPKAIYTFSISPANQHENRQSRLKLIQNDLCKTLSYLGNQKVFTFTIYPELGPTGRLHWHGIITIKDPLAFYTNLFRITIHNTFEIDTIKDEDEWFTYYTKGKQYMENSGLHYPITHEKRKETLMELAGIKPRRGAIDDFLADVTSDELESTRRSALE